MTTFGPFSLEGRRALVTGGAMGIGKGIARRFVEAGADVIVADLDEHAAARHPEASPPKAPPSPWAKA